MSNVWFAGVGWTNVTAALKVTPFSHDRSVGAMIGTPPKRRFTGTRLICFVMRPHVILQPRRVNEWASSNVMDLVHVPRFTGTNERDMWSRAFERMSVDRK